MRRLWVDDLREPPRDWDWAKNSVEAIQFLSNIPFVEISLDHDLGGDDTGRPVVLWMIENDCWPAVVRCHSANPVGREWIEGMIGRYRP